MAYWECAEPDCDYAVGDPDPAKVEARMKFHMDGTHCPCGGFGGDECPMMDRAEMPGPVGPSIPTGPPTVHG